MLADGTVRRCDNVHPAPRSAFALAPQEALFLARSLDTDNPARVLYHSHPDGNPRPSAADFECAALHPSLAHAVVAGGVLHFFRLPS